MSEYYDNDDVLTKLRRGLGKGLRIVNIRSKEVYETVLIKNKIQSHKKKRKKSVTDLGESVFRMFKHKDSFDEENIRTKCTSVAKLEQEIKDFEDELSLVHLNAQKELGKLKAIAKPDGDNKA